MKDFLYRTITEENEVTDKAGRRINMAAWRTRNSNGHRMIGISFGDQRIEFTHDDEYEQHARMLVEMLDKVIDEPCLLPGFAEKPNDR